MSGTLVSVSSLGTLGYNLKPSNVTLWYSIHSSTQYTLVCNPKLLLRCYCFLNQVLTWFLDQVLTWFLDQVLTWFLDQVLTWFLDQVLTWFLDQVLTWFFVLRVLGIFSKVSWYSRLLPPYVVNAVLLKLCPELYQSRGNLSAINVKMDTSSYINVKTDTSS